MSEIAQKVLIEAIGSSLCEELLELLLNSSTPPIDLPREHDNDLANRRESALSQLEIHLPSLSADELRDLRASLSEFSRRYVPLPEAVLIEGLDDAYFVFPITIFERPREDSKVLMAVPRLDELTDEDGLTDIEGLEVLGPGLDIDGKFVYFHQFLRRHFVGSINEELINLLRDLGQSNRVRIAIDDRRICDVDDVKTVKEAARWYGASLSEAWLDDQYKVGRTVHRDTDGDETLRGFSAFFAHWRMMDADHKVVQMEELQARSEVFRGDLRVVRYLHAIRDIKTKTFIHCDGAVRAYSVGTYDIRCSQEMPPEIRADRYRKVFRVDGAISGEQWANVVMAWFRHNYLVSEYFETFMEPALVD